MHAGIEQVVVDDGQSYLLFVPLRAHRPPPGGMEVRNSSGSPHFAPLMLIVAGALVSLVLAALLARNFSKPIRSLRSAFAAAADGDLEQNFGNAMGKRRDELAALGRDCDRMAVPLKILMDSQCRLLHNVSHELRSPLARLQAATGLARQQTERIEDSLARIDRESDRMDKLVSELLGNVVDDARFEARASQCRIERSVDKHVFERGNAELLHSAENIVCNAVKHSPAGGLVEVSAAVVAREVIGRVVDWGHGVAEADIASIFKSSFAAVGKLGRWSRPLAGHFAARRRKPAWARRCGESRRRRTVRGFPCRRALGLGPVRQGPNYWRRQAVARWGADVRLAGSTGGACIGGAKRRDGRGAAHRLLCAAPLLSEDAPRQPLLRYSAK